MTNVNDESLHAYIKQLSAIGYTKDEICNKLHITRLQLFANYYEDFKQGQHLYVVKQMKLYRQQQNNMSNT